MSEEKNWLASWVWRREAKPERLKYKVPYTFSIGGRDLVLAQSKEAIGCTLWDASIVMARFLEHAVATGSVDLKQKRVLELGCGAQALPGFAAAMLGAREVVLTDSGAKVMDLLAKNVDAAREKLPKESKDIILVADCMYIEEAIPPLLECILEVSTEDTEIFVSYGGNRSAEDAFNKAAKDWRIRHIPTAEWHPDFFSPDHSLLSMTPPNLSSSKAKRRRKK